VTLLRRPGGVTAAPGLISCRGDMTNNDYASEQFPPDDDEIEDEG